MPIIPKTRKKNNIKTKVFPNSGKDFSMMLTNLLSLGTLLTDLRGLITLKALKTLSDGTSNNYESTISTILITTTTKSITFQPLLR